MSTKKVTSKEAKKTTGSKVTSKEATKKDYEVINPLYSKNRLEKIVATDISLDIVSLDNLLKNCDKSTQLNQLKKDTKVNMTVYYLLHQYKGAIRKKMQRDIARFIEDNEKFYDKDSKCFTDFELNSKLVNMQKSKKRTLDDIQDKINELPEKVGIDKLYTTYCMYQRNKKGDNKSLYEDIYKMHIGQWLFNNSVLPSEKLLVYLANEVTTKLNTSISDNVDKDKSNLKLLFDKKEFNHYFISTFVDLLIDKHIINKKSYLTNKDFLESLKGLEVENSLQYLQEVIEKTGVEIEE